MLHTECSKENLINILASLFTSTLTWVILTGEGKVQDVLKYFESMHPFFRIRSKIGLIYVHSCNIFFFRHGMSRAFISLRCCNSVDKIRRSIWMHCLFRFFFSPETFKACSHFSSYYRNGYDAKNNWRYLTQSIICIICGRQNWVHWNSYNHFLSAKGPVMGL